MGTSPRLYVNVNSPNWCWSLIIPGFPPPSLPVCIEEIYSAKEKRVLIHKSGAGGETTGGIRELLAFLPWGCSSIHHPPLPI